MRDRPAGEDLPGVRALLIGSGRHTRSSGLPDLPAVRTTVADLKATLSYRCGIPDARISVLDDPPDLQAIGDAVAAAAAAATDLLLVAYVGHGVLSADGMLHLAAATTAATGDRVGHTGLRYVDVAKLIRNSPATYRVVLLDCCFAGRALDGLSGLGEPDDALADRAQVPGGFVITSASRLDTALSPPGARHTAFTGALLGLLADGVPGGPPELTLEGIARRLSQVLPDEGFPRPRYRADNRVGELIVALNPAYRARAVASPRFPAPDPVIGELVCPYKGLAAYDVGDARWFHGRDTLRAQMVRELAERYETRGRMLVVLGVSGAGKSSLLRAGLLPAVERGELEIAGSSSWPRLIFNPGAAPVDALAAQLAAAVGRPTAEIEQLLRIDPSSLPALIHRTAGPRVVLVADQFEEFFTDDIDDTERQTFVRALTALTNPASGEPAALAAVGIRAEWYGRCAVWPELAPLLADQPLVVGAMTPEEILQAIEGPARQAGLRVEPELVGMLLDDLADAASALEPGRLPLLSHALRTTWQEQTDGVLTVAAYRRTGGIRHGVAVAADRVISSLGDQRQDSARRLLLRLVRIGEGTEHTRRRVPRAELLAGLPADAVVVLDALAGDDARLLTIDDGTVFMTHEALIDAWPVLRTWIDRDRATLAVEQDLADAATRWDTRGRRAGDLYSGTSLLIAGTWARDTRHRDGLPGTAKLFLDESISQQNKRSRLRAVVGLIVVVMLVVSSVAAVIAYRQWRTATDQTVSSVADSLMLQSEALRGTNPGLALRLGLAAEQLRPGVETRHSLVKTVLESPYRGAIEEAGYHKIAAVAFAPGDRMLAVADGLGSIDLWDVPAPGPARHRARLGTARAETVKLAFAPDGRTLAVGDDAVRLWNVTDPDRPAQQRVIPATAGVTALAFTPDSAKVAVSGTDKRILLWSVASSSSKPVVLTGQKTTLTLSVSLDGKTLAAGGSGPGLMLYRLDTDAAPIPSTPKGARGATVTALSFGPANRLASGDSTGTVAIWKVVDGASNSWQTVPVSRRGVLACRFAPDGTRLTGISGDGAIYRVNFLPGGELTSSSAMVQAGVRAGAADVGGGGVLAATAAPGTVTVVHVDGTAKDPPFAAYGPGKTGFRTIGWSADGRQLADSQAGGKTVLWNMAAPLAPKPIGTVAAAATPGRTAITALRPDGQAIATTALDANFAAHNGTVQLWSLDAGRAIRAAAVTVAQAPITAVRFAPDGRTLAIATVHGLITLWDIHDIRAPRKIAQATVATASALAFSPDGDRLAVAGYTATVFNIRDRSRPVRLGDIGNPGRALAVNKTSVSLASSTVAYSPRGDAFAIGWAGGDVTLYATAGDRYSGTGVILGHTDRVNGISFSRDGRILATGSSDGTAVVWDVDTPSAALQLMTIGAQMGSIGDVGFMPNGTFLAAAGSNSVAKIWNLGTVMSAVADPARQACEMLGGGFTAEEWTDWIPEGVDYRPTCR